MAGNCLLAHLLPPFVLHNASPTEVVALAPTASHTDGDGQETEARLKGEKANLATMDQVGAEVSRRDLAAAFGDNQRGEAAGTGPVQRGPTAAARRTARPRTGRTNKP